MKKIIFLLIISISTSAFPQADQKIAELMNKGDYLKLLEVYPTAKNNLAYPFLGAIAEGGINSALNKPLEANKVYNSLLNQNKNLDQSLLYSIAYIYTEQLAKIGKYDEASKILDNMLRTNDFSDTSKKILNNLYKLYSKMQNVPACKVERISSKNNNAEMITRNGYWYIPTKVNGRKEEFLFDTGAGKHFISESFAKRNHIKIIADSVMPMSSGFINNEIHHIKQGIVDTIQIGNILYMNVPVCIIDSIAPHSKKAGFIIDAVLGPSFLETMEHVVIFPKENKISFPIVKASTTANPNMTSFLGEIMLQCSYKEQKFSLLMDTGCITESQINYDFYQQNLNLFKDSKFKRTDINMAGLFGDTIRNERYLIDNFPISIGDYKSKGNNQFSISKSIQSNGTGVIGIGFFKECKEISFDFRNMVITLK